MYVHQYNIFKCFVFVQWTCSVFVLISSIFLEHKRYFVLGIDESNIQILFFREDIGPVVE